MAIHAIIFDLDGTLLDTLDDIADAGNAVLTRNGYPTHTKDDYRYFVGDGAPVLIRRVLPKDARKDELIERLYQEFRAEYARRWSLKTRPYDGVPRMLEGLSVRGLKLAVLSNKPDDFTKACATELLASGRFDVVAGLREGVPPKPDPTGAMWIADELGVSPAECMFVGDTSIDIKTALAAGMEPVGVAWGFRPIEELESAGARRILESPDDIFSLL
ncbi:MAG: HAD family hydrolase [Candidatus Latescibacterota bacterium]|nr:MAG: HAD family hydrolase [Candidatus Latescibacterota bacterium]